MKEAVTSSISDALKCVSVCVCVYLCMHAGGPWISSRLIVALKLHYLYYFEKVISPLCVCVLFFEWLCVVNKIKCGSRR